MKSIKSEELEHVAGGISTARAVANRFGFGQDALASIRRMTPERAFSVGLVAGHLRPQMPFASNLTYTKRYDPTPKK